MSIKVNIKNPKGLTEKEIKDMLPRLAAFVKQSVGVWNNAAQIEVMNAYDAIRKHPDYRFKVKKAFESAVQSYRDYEKRLLHTDEVRYFRVDDMPPQIRKKYGDISDKDYFELWQNVGWSVYSEHSAFFSALKNKFRLAFKSHNIDNTEILAQCMVTEQCLKIADESFELIIRESKKLTGLPIDFLMIFFKDFSLRKTHELWTKACDMVVPKFSLTDVECKNIQNGIDDICSILGSTDNMFDAVSKSIEDYEELFRTKGEQKKALREIADVKYGYSK